MNDGIPIAEIKNTINPQQFWNPQWLQKRVRKHWCGPLRLRGVCDMDCPETCSILSEIVNSIDKDTANHGGWPLLVWSLKDKVDDMVPKSTPIQARTNRLGESVTIANPVEELLSTYEAHIENRAGLEQVVQAPGAVFDLQKLRAL